jgi:hypothetical protein
MRMNVGPRDGQDLGHDDLRVVRADAGGDDRDPKPAVRACDRVELTMVAPHLDLVEERRDAFDAIGIAREQDVVRYFAGAKVDVVLAVRVGRRDLGVRVRHGNSFSLASPGARLPRNDSHRDRRASSHHPRWEGRGASVGRHAGRHRAGRPAPTM